MQRIAATILAAAGVSSLTSAQCETALLSQTGADLQAEFGAAIALEGANLVVSAPHPRGPTGSPGRVSFFRNVAGTWTEIDTKAPTVFDNNDVFGGDVAISGNTALVSMHLADTPAGGAAGQVFVYEWNGAAWDEVQVLRAKDAQNSDMFGTSVAIDGDTLAVGAEGVDDVAQEAGAVYVFERAPGGWVQRAKLLASNGAGWDFFGSALALCGDTLAVGSASDVAGDLGGAVYVFTGGPSGWTETATLIGSGVSAFDSFGSAISLEGDTLVATSGSFAYPSSTTGTVHVFERSGGVWSESATLQGVVDDAGDMFGFRHALSGDRLLIGAPRTDNPGGANNSGVAYLYHRTAQDWVLVAQLRPSNLGEAIGIGRAVAFKGSTVARRASRRTTS